MEMGELNKASGNSKVVNEFSVWMELQVAMMAKHRLVVTDQP